MLDVIYGWLELLEARVNRAIASASAGGVSNRAFTAPGAPNPHTPTTGAAQINLIAIAIKATKSGRFLCHFEIPFTGATSTDTYDHQVNVDQSSVVPTFVNSGGAGDTIAHGCTTGPGFWRSCPRPRAASGSPPRWTPRRSSMTRACRRFDTTGTGVIRWIGYVAGLPLNKWAIVRISVALSGGVLGGTNISAYAIEQA